VEQEIAVTEVIVDKIEDVIDVVDVSAICELVEEAMLDVEL